MTDNLGPTEYQKYIEKIVTCMIIPFGSIGVNYQSFLDIPPVPLEFNSQHWTRLKSSVLPELRTGRELDSQPGNNVWKKRVKQNIRQNNKLWCFKESMLEMLSALVNCYTQCNTAPELRSPLPPGVCSKTLCYTPCNTRLWTRMSLQPHLILNLPPRIPPFHKP